MSHAASKRFKVKIFAGLAAVLIAAGVFSAFRLSAHIPTIRETLPPPLQLTSAIDTTENYLLLYETEYLSFYYTPFGNIAVSDKRGETPFVWKTGLDIPFNSDIDVMLIGMDADEITARGITKEDRLSDIHVAFANSLILVEFINPRTNNTTTVGNASRRGVESAFYGVEHDPSRYVMIITIEEADIQLWLHIRFTPTGMELSVPQSSIRGEEAYRLAAITLAPFLGAAGGARLHYNPETQQFDIRVPNEMPPAYALLPDGSGALARFRENYVELTMYRQPVFGSNYSHHFDNMNYRGFIIPPFDPLMPLYGVAYGHDEFAFLAHAVSGGEYMEVIFRPAQNVTFYNCVFARFEYNRFYFQLFHTLGSTYGGDGFQSLLEPPNRFDLALNIEFLASAGEHAANYAGMARYYRDYLLSTGQLTPSRIPREGDIPLHVDILMSDVRSALAGITNVVVTTADDVDTMLDLIRANGITNIHASLMGFKENGWTAARIDRNNFSNAIGTRRDFENLINRQRQQGADISFAQDYANINNHNSTFINHAVRHINGRFVETYFDRMSAWATNMPVESTALLRFDKAADMIRNFSNTMDFTDSITIMGISNQLYSQHNRNATFSVTQNMDIIRGAFCDVSSQMLVNADAPNQYLWAYTDRFLNTPMFSSQFLATTDTVPFLQLVLHGSVDMFSPHVNFSFYSRADMLRMIDYNVFPSFMFTMQPSYLLAQTNSSHRFSTEFSQYEALLYDVYAKVNGILRMTAGAQWVNREVVSPGVVVNTYDNGMRVIINYTAEAVTIFGVTVDALSAKGVQGA
ncbi:MAG: DUF5696 domain-containing protein [Defluviitaleaceae bacterium]|nr:DUF5696 domain-containing protein [Defluviitaleaceae bacterium]